MIGALAMALVQRPMVSLDVTKDRGLFRENNLGQIENIYSLKVINKTQQRQQYRLELLDGADFQLHGHRRLPGLGGDDRRTGEKQLPGTRLPPRRPGRPERLQRGEQPLRRTDEPLMT